MRVIMSFVVLSLVATAPATAGLVTVGPLVNLSSANPANPNLTFLTESTMSSVTGGGGFYTFSHRMAFLNEHIATGGFAQTNKRNVSFRFDFTVTDPGNVGYTINLDSLMRGVSYINQTLGTSTASASGLSMAFQYGVNLADSSDTSSYTNLPGPLYGMGTSGASVVGIGSNSTFAERFETGQLPGGVYVGTNTFSIFVTTAITPTTNVLFQNNHQGMGFVNYGLGDDFAGFDVDANDLGHFLTVNVAYVPSPAGLALLGFGALCARPRRRLK